MTLDFHRSRLSKWNFFYLFFLLALVFFLLFGALVRLQIVESSELKRRSERNSIATRYEYPNRGLIYDRNGVKLAENIPSVSVSLDYEEYIDEEGHVREVELEAALMKLEKIIGSSWQNLIPPGSERSYSTLKEYIVSSYEKSGVGELIVATDLSNDQTIQLKAGRSEIAGLNFMEGSKRRYPAGEPFAHLLGYTTLITAEDLSQLDYLEYESLLANNGYQDVLGRTGLERVYDELLLGKRGLVAVEVDAFGVPVGGGEREMEAVESGQNLFLSIDKAAQEKMYQILAEGVAQYNAAGASGIVMDVESGEIIAMSNYPSFDNNMFVGGISNEEYKSLIENPKLPLLDRAISAQLPPGSTFKTIALAAALDSGEINLKTKYLSRAGYTFSNGAPFQEYNGRSYGMLNPIDAITVSSNIYFCEVIRNWDIEELVPYYDSFGIGKPTGIDLIGEGYGRLPSPANKIALAKTPGITWLDPIWYPEGDGCNTIIGQGISLVTPIQMVNWVAAIANGGTLHTPHLGVITEDANGDKTELAYEPLAKEFISESALKSTRDAMRSAVNGSRRSIVDLSDAKSHVAAKTGTAEFGRLNSKGQYEHAHAWVTGFFPYEKPKYAFVVLLEDGGQSYYSARLARQFIDWWVENGYMER